MRYISLRENEGHAIISYIQFEKRHPVNRQLVVFVSILAFAILPVSADIKDQVCVVYPQLEQNVKDSFLSLAKQLESSGEEDFAGFFKAYAEGGFASGFVVLDDAKRPWIVTNRHVAAMASRAKIEFQKNDGSKVSYEDCPVVYMDDSTDLAFISLPDTFKAGADVLAIATEPLKDGDEVWSAGFPALLGRPSWQYGKGYVTNGRVEVPELANTEATWFLQHSAPIDSGNSGGPLLVRSEKRGVVSYSVVGINTWSMGGRQSTFFAIPSSVIPALLLKATRIATISSGEIDEQLIPTVESFASALSGKSPDTVSDFRFISYSAAAKSGWSDLVILELTLSKEESAEAQKKRTSGLPIEVFRHAVWDKMKIGFKRSFETVDVAFAEISSPPEDGEIGRTAKILLTVGGKKFATKWKWEGGHWRFLDADLSGVFDKDALATNTEKKSSIANVITVSDDVTPNSDSWDFIALRARGGLGIVPVPDTPVGYSYLFGFEKGTVHDYPEFWVSNSNFFSFWNTTIDGSFPNETGKSVHKIYGLRYLLCIAWNFKKTTRAVAPVMNVGFGGSLGAPFIASFEGQIGGGFEFGKQDTKRPVIGVGAVCNGVFAPLMETWIIIPGLEIWIKLPK